MLHGCAFQSCETLTLSAYCFEHELFIRAEIEAERTQLAGRDESAARAPADVPRAAATPTTRTGSGRAAAARGFAGESSRRAPWPATPCSAPNVGASPAGGRPGGRCASARTDGRPRSVRNARSSSSAEPEGPARSSPVRASPPGSWSGRARPRCVLAPSRAGRQWLDNVPCVVARRDFLTSRDMDRPGEEVVPRRTGMRCTSGSAAAPSLERATTVGGAETGRLARARAARVAQDAVQRRVLSSCTPLPERNTTGPNLDTAASGGLIASPPPRARISEAISRS
jgi:hypothetical protein